MKLEAGTWNDLLYLPFLKRGRCGSLPSILTIAQISSALAPVKPIKPSPDSDGKIKIEWIVKVEGIGVFTVHDYKGMRWSVGGDVNAARAVLGAALIEGRI